MSLRQLAIVERLFAEHRVALRAFFRRRVRINADVADLAQEVYLRMLSVSNAEGIRNPEYYLYTVASNLAKEHAALEHRRGTSAALDADDVQAQLAELPSFDGDIDAEQRAERLRAVLATLSPKCQAVVMLQYREGLSYQEIGRQLDISTSMVKKYLAQAIDHCRRRISRLR